MNQESNALSFFENWLNDYLNFERTPKKNIFWLDTMNFLCKEFGDPQNRIPCVHVAGSKGKGSVSAMISSVLEENKVYTGIYTSPHITDFRERVTSSRGFFSDEVYRKSAEEIINKMSCLRPEDFPGGRPVTWFELVTLFGMQVFRNAGCECAVYEVGLGGRFDSTNVVKPNVCCIGPIELEHTEFLGDTIEKIAAEKGGIIKENVPVVIGFQTKVETKKIFAKIAAEKKAPIIFADENCSVKTLGYVADGKKVGMEILIESSLFKRPLHTVIKLLGKFQAQNAAVASIACKTIYPELDESVIERGLANAFLPGRFEIISDVNGYSDIPFLVFDGAHTVNSVTYTMETFKKLYADYSNNCELIFACAADKNSKEIAPLFANEFSRTVITRPGETKSCDTEQMVKSFTEAGVDFEDCFDYKKAIQSSLEYADTKKVPLLVTGSFYLVSEVKKFLMNK